MSESNHPPEQILGDGFLVNYLHYGNAMDNLPSKFQLLGSEKSFYKKDVVTYLQSLRGMKERDLRHLVDIVSAFGKIRSRKLNTSDIATAIEESQKWRLIFHSLNCRGFSFRLCEDPAIHTRLKSHVNIRIALVAEPTLYYPPKVREGIEKFCSMAAHVPRGIGWMLGTKEQVEGKNWWFILNLQSDLISAQISSLKEIFRGWQRVLFQLVIMLAQRHGISVIAIPSARAVAKARSFHATRSVPENWLSLYDRTAEFFSMQWTSLREPIDLQTIWYSPAVWCSEFFVGDVSELIGGKVKGVKNKKALVPLHPKRL